jgi:hypothetical protein
VDQDLCEFTGSEDELWYQIDVVVPVSAELGGYGLVWAEFAVELVGAVVRSMRMG